MTTDFFEDAETELRRILKEKEKEIRRLKRKLSITANALRKEMEKKGAKAEIKLLRAANQD